MQQTVTISSKSRNLGIGWTTRTINGEYGGWQLATPDHPTVQGGRRTCLEELEHAYRVCGQSTYYSVALFVGGHRVVSHEYRQEIRELLTYLDRDGVEVVIETPDPAADERSEFPAYVGWDGKEHAEF